MAEKIKNDKAYEESLRIGNRRRNANPETESKPESSIKISKTIPSGAKDGLTPVVDTPAST